MRVAHRARVRIVLLCSLVVIFSSCAPPRARDVCAAIPLGTPIENVSNAAATPVSSGDWCSSHPQRDRVGPITELRCCMRGTSQDCNTDCSQYSGAELHSVGPFQDEEFDPALCCALVRDGKVAARYVAYD
jgi:hypothetical protein